MNIIVDAIINTLINHFKKNGDNFNFNFNFELIFEFDFNNRNKLLK